VLVSGFIPSSGVIGMPSFDFRVDETNLDKLPP
jgi:hypothetical protein